MAFDTRLKPGDIVNNDQLRGLKRNGMKSNTSFLNNLQTP